MLLIILTYTSSNLSAHNCKTMYRPWFHITNSADEIQERWNKNPMNHTLMSVTVTYNTCQNLLNIHSFTTPYFSNIDIPRVMGICAWKQIKCIAFEWRMHSWQLMNAVIMAFWAFFANDNWTVFSTSYTWYYIVLYDTR